MHWQRARGKTLTLGHSLWAWCTFLQLPQAEPLVGTPSLGKCKYFRWELQDLSFMSPTFHASDTEPRLSACHSIANNQEPGTGGRKGGLFKELDVWEGGRLTSKRPLNNWTLAGIFVRREGKKGGDWEFSIEETMCKPTQSVQITRWGQQISWTWNVWRLESVSPEVNS